MENSKLRKWQKGVFGFLFTSIGLALVLIAYLSKVLEWNWVTAWEYVSNIGGAIILFIGVWFIYAFIMHNKEKKKITVKEMSMVAIQSAITIILYYFVKINLPFFPGFLDIQVSEIPALITSFMYGPYVGSLVIIIRFIVKLPASMTAGVGEIADLLIGLTIVILSGLIYKRKRTFKGALLGIVIGTISATVVACFANWLILIPAYTRIAGLPMSAIIGMCSMIPGINENNFMQLYIFVGVLPFNLFRFILVALLTILLYKRTHALIQKITK